MRVKTGSIGRGVRVQTIEKTAKRFKAAMFLAKAMLVLSLPTILLGAIADPGWNWIFLVPGALMFVSSPMLAVYSKIGAWWHNS
jgi:hypothetical protein